jgi:chloride channel 3/4/5
MTESKLSIAPDERIWYDQFTCTDWVHDGIADSYRIKQLRNRKDWRGRLTVLFDGAQGWVLSAVVGFLVAVLAYCVDVAETTIFDFKDGYCARAWYLNEQVCCIMSHCTLFRLKCSPVRRRPSYARSFPCPY